MSSLAPNVTATFTLDMTALSGVNWNNLRALVLVESPPGGDSGPYDTLQAIALSQ